MVYLFVWFFPKPISVLFCEDYVNLALFKRDILMFFLFLPSGTYFPIVVTKQHLPCLEFIARDCVSAGNVLSVNKFI